MNAAALAASADAPAPPPDAPPHTDADDCAAALALFAADPLRFGGLWLRGRDYDDAALLDALEQALPPGIDMRTVPRSADDSRLLGGLDIAASLARGRAVQASGLLAECAGQVVLIRSAERIGPELAGRLVQAMDSEGQGFAIVLIDQGEDDEAPPTMLTERLAFRLIPPRDVPLPGRAKAGSHAVMSAEAREALAATAIALGVQGSRPLIFADRATQLSASLAGRAMVEEKDIALAARLTLAPRATRMPPPPEPPEPEDSDDPEPPPPPPDNDDPGDSEDQSVGELDERIVEATAIAIPADLLAALGSGRSVRRSAGAGGASGQKRKANMRGRPLGARRGMPSGGKRLSLIDTLRSAAPWQTLRKQREAQIGTSTRPASAVRVARDDLHVKRYEERSTTVVIFTVDASGSAAAARLAESKGAVERMLAQSYQTRSEVALIAFRGTSAELLLPPTRSLTRARRVLAGLPGGGGTPLAIGLNAAEDLAMRQKGQGRTPFIVVLTDGKANIGADGAPGRPAAMADAEKAARRIAASGYKGAVIDISPFAQPQAQALAAAMDARYVPLPRADARALEGAVSSLMTTMEKGS